MPAFTIGYDDNCPNNYTPRREETLLDAGTDSKAAWAAYNRVTANDCRTHYPQPTDRARFGWCVTLYVGSVNGNRHVLSAKEIHST